MTTLNPLATLVIDRCMLLAGQAQYIHMGRRFRRGGGVDWSDLWLPIAVIVCAAAIAWFVSRYLKLREARKADNPQALFAELCQAHRLNWSNQQLLRALANAHRLPSPAQLFVEPERFDVAPLGRAFASRQARIAALRARLFGSTADEEPEATSGEL